jgi:ketosteroid isomerase-like protein
VRLRLGVLSTSDRSALADLAHRYAAYADARAVDRVVGLFTDDAVLVVPEPPRTLEPDLERHGPDGVRETLGALQHAVRTFHEVVGEVYDGGASPDRAEGAVAAVIHHVIDRDGSLTDLVWHVRYADEYRRTCEGWRISRRAVTIELVETRPVQRVLR